MEVPVKINWAELVPQQLSIPALPGAPLSVAAAVERGSFPGQPRGDDVWFGQGAGIFRRAEVTKARCWQGLAVE